MDAPLYLYTGPEFGERNAAVQAVKDAMKKKYGVLDEYLFYAADTPVSEVVTILQSGSLFSSASCVVFRAAEVIKKKEDVDMIAGWAKSAGGSTSALVLVSDEISVDAKLDKTVPAPHKKVFWEMFEDRKIPWLTDFFRKNGYSVSDDAAEDILDMVENNTEELRSECSRFFILFPKGHEITAGDVDDVLAHNREESAFTLFDTMSSVEPPGRRFELSLDVLQKIRLSKDSSSVMIIAGLSSCFRRLEIWHRLNASGQTDDFSLKINGFSSRKAKSQYSRASQIWSPGQAAAILAELASTDMDIRSGGALMEDTLLQKLVYEIVVKKGASCAEYEAV
ncbi:MAG TPA: DNA polymerase III subunit delta [Treponema sp.]|nr:DNA polymerase III subunit delta [Treponema sp.]